MSWEVIILSLLCYIHLSIGTRKNLFLINANAFIEINSKCKNCTRTASGCFGIGLIHDRLKDFVVFPFLAHTNY